MKDNANPTIYSISDERKQDSDDYIATDLLKRLSQGRTLSGEHDPTVVVVTHDNDSLYHLNPSKLLTPLERSIRAALSDIHRAAGGSAVGDDPLNILSMAGIKCGGDAGAGADRMASLYHFRPASCRTNTDDDEDADQNAEDIGERVEEGREASGKMPIPIPITKQQRDPITASEVFDIIRNIQDPEHPLTLQQLNVVNRNHVEVYDAYTNADDDLGKKKDGSHYRHSTIDVKFTPTIPHCSMATLIGLCIRVKLLRSVPKRFKVTVRINPGTHASEMAVNRQLNDKERVIAALENTHLLGVVNKCIANGMNAAS